MLGQITVAVVAVEQEPLVVMVRLCLAAMVVVALFQPSLALVNTMQVVAARLFTIQRQVELPALAVLAVAARLLLQQVLLVYLAGQELQILAAVEAVVEVKTV
jgi:hypothetical protein